MYTHVITGYGVNAFLVRTEPFSLLARKKNGLIYLKFFLYLLVSAASAAAATSLLDLVVC